MIFALQRFNSEGQLIAQEELDLFWQWFGRSDVVDHVGRPLVVYHGTTVQFDGFDRAKSVDGAFHFGTKAQASMRAGSRDRRLIAAYLHAERLMRSRDTGGGWKEKVASARASGKDGIVYLNRYEGMTTEVIERLSGQGILSKLDHMTDAQFRKVVPESMDSYIVFDTSQILTLECVPELSNTIRRAP